MHRVLSLLVLSVVAVSAEHPATGTPDQSGSQHTIPSGSGNGFPDVDTPHAGNESDHDELRLFELNHFNGSEDRPHGPFNGSDVRPHFNFNSSDDHPHFVFNSTYGRPHFNFNGSDVRRHGPGNASDDRPFGRGNGSDDHPHFVFNSTDGRPHLPFNGSDGRPQWHPHGRWNSSEFDHQGHHFNGSTNGRPIDGFNASDAPQHGSFQASLRGSRSSSGSDE
ncbi:hypothetical protein SDRG_16222 [Saprolegnia diclina VS20]|uniref:Uncharacterized protein n=1 Tax=Saprolegnia diclina (strain VS20) TaxID=1156394 RepID=T0R1P9_SAPDV|nr:hypothetical protein SDRG_16222 [Saprolegnia diclina VS20]EQC25923.1 hypothetical protein SDRG_16222 [Saprolegnia diclina VS20]|eukprot:XP_008620645.1 hypothetical protein SDRG_16222 [Saprolegnia diclina VS20]